MPSMDGNNVASKALSYQGKLILAPMVRIGTTPTRLLALEYGADLVYTEEIVDWRLLRSVRVDNPVLNTIDYIDKSDNTLVLRIAKQERGHLVLQIGTCDPERAVQVAKKMEADVDAIDVNMGCPKSFSLKGGMGAALLTQPQKIHSIMSSLVKAARIPVTCKIRILPNLEDTLHLVDTIQSTGVAALAVHGRTKDERPNHANHIDVIQAVVKHARIPVIANGGSSNNRDSPANSYDGIQAFWRESGAASVMVARAAEWNASVFRKEGKLDIYEVIARYLDHAIHLDYAFVVTKYNVQQILGSDQETELGKKFLSCSTMKELCAVFGKEAQFVERRQFLEQETSRLNMSGALTSSRNLGCDQALVPRKRKLADLEHEDFQKDQESFVTEMYCPFVRGHYSASTSIPKAVLHCGAVKRDWDKPVYISWQKDKMFRSVVIVNKMYFSSQSWEKNKRNSEQAAALVALHCLELLPDQPADIV